MPRKDYYQRFAKLGLTTKEEYLDFFLLNKVKLSESSLKNHFSDFAAALEDFSSLYAASSYPELVYAYLLELSQPPLCKHCGNTRVKFKQFSHGYFVYCSVKCSSNSAEKKAAIIETNLGRYGAKNPSLNLQIQRKREATFELRYGVKSAPKTERFKLATNKTCQERYGANYFYGSLAGQQSRKKAIKNLYGHENPMQHPDIAQRSLQTRIDQGLICKWTVEQEQSLALYRLAVKMHSERSYRKHFEELNPERKRRSRHQYHLDHIFPVVEGWLRGVPPHLIAHPKNLQLLWCTDNIVKGARTDVTVEAFYEWMGAAGVLTERKDSVFVPDEDF